MTTRTVAITAVPEAAPAWWIHWCNLAISAISFVGVCVHPGWHPPAELVEIVGPLALVLAIGSGVVFAVLHHQTGTSNVAAAYSYVSAHAGELTSAAAALAPLVDRYPAVEARLGALEKTPATKALSPQAQRLLDALNGTPVAPAAPVPAPGAPAVTGAP